MGATKLGQSIDAFPEIDRLDGDKNPHMRGEGNHDFVAQNVFPNSTKSKQETPFACILITEPSLFIISMVDSIKETDGAGNSMNGEEKLSDVPESVFWDFLTCFSAPCN